MTYLRTLNFENFKLDEFFSLTRPCPKTLVMAGWKLTKNANHLPSAPAIYIIHGDGDGHLGKSWCQTSLLNCVLEGAHPSLSKNL
jgi:hypothetical protein